MIQIVRLVGESFDFTSEQEVGKSFVLSNGISERIVEATAAQIQAVLELYGEAAAGEAPELPRSSATAHRSTVPKNGSVNGKAVPAKPSVKVPPPQEELEAGEEYMDEHGTQSV